MGNYVSAVNQARYLKARSEAIDKQIEEDKKQSNRECKLLLLGPRHSGKSTLVKQMKIVHQGGFSNTDLAEWRPVVYQNVLESAKALVMYMRTVSLECHEYSNRVSMEQVLDFPFEPPNTINFTFEIANAIHQVWEDPVIPEIMDNHSSEFYLMDNAPYFFNEVLRIGAPDYLPNETDVLRARHRNMGVTETRFLMGTLSIRMFDVGGLRSEREKWIHCFQDVTSIVFCTALDQYDQILEGQSQNQMLESLALFESVINSRWFHRTSIVLFLNKIDVFKNKLPKVPLQQFFPDYTGGTDINKAVKYILWRFMQANRARLSVYPHITQATDTTNIGLIFTAVKETILQNALKDIGRL
ncbi:heterotrimeric G-protein alpha subunit, GPA3-like protein [Pluteus cervinus]|uniref:Heterotrimeric G-protein alpha subunit, GPA3-like protein n=1 Tax=Pluteus cervinus TaxID=181527 RepID=A0ACD3AP52_9AGAR|nr:heterotrimeric G-protein alpha subunit, GPA3-like protein [Pluteus cervinus]